MKLDPVDLAILDALQREGRIANVRLAAQVHLSESACLRRTRMLEEAGVIARYAAVVDPRAVGLPDNVFVSIALQRQDQTDLDTFERAVCDVPEVMECYLMTGEFDYLLRVVVADASDYERVHRSRLTRLPGVARVQSSFALRVVQDAVALPLGVESESR
ncbi:MAG: Lrp/AsnC family transcriptional regulator [Deltaproteobacteria bacterium]|nr:Lrp/AsnC family transcriptional regulator [Deltaproteobacteria bacterium]MBW2362486.1 Lrp/AsnC family transcriptional regulator [Deltaproteobacteria bacterium]